MAEVRGVKKTGYNSAQGYRYASDADLLGPLQESMSRHGLMIHPGNVDLTQHPWPTKDGKPATLVTVVVTYWLRHASGESVQVQAPGQGWDFNDKGAYKAMTGAFKYMLRQTFAVPTGDDAERSQGNRRDSAPRDTRPLPSNEDSREALRKLWHARLDDLHKSGATWELSEDDRHMVQGELWDSRSSKDLSDADCAYHLDMLRGTSDAKLADIINEILGAGR
jgi:hypothetical protein